MRDVTEGLSNLASEFGPSFSRVIMVSYSAAVIIAKETTGTLGLSEPLLFCLTFTSRRLVLQ
jgi:hypothetical protein